MQERKKRKNRNEGKTNEQTKQLKERKIKQKYVQNNQQRKN